MATITFDTLKFAKRMEKSGMPREQATALAEAQKDSLAEVLDSTLASKDDIHLLRIDVVGIKSEMTTIKWMMGVLVALAVANFAAQFF